MTVGISDSQKSAAPNPAFHPVGVEERYEVDHFDGGLVQSERSQSTDDKDGESKQSGDKERIHSRGKDIEKGREQAPQSTDDRNSQTSAMLSEDKFERSTRGDMSRGLKDGERHRTRRKESRSWADETDDMLADEQKSFSAFVSDIDGGGQSSRKDEGRSATQYSRPDRRKCY